MNKVFLRHESEFAVHIGRMQREILTRSITGAFSGSFTWGDWQKEFWSNTCVFEFTSHAHNFGFVSPECKIPISSSINEGISAVLHIRKTLNLT